MICRICDLGVEIPDIGDLPERCFSYKEDVPVDIFIDKAKSEKISWPNLTKNENIYLNSGFLFYDQLISFSGIMIHASAVVLDGIAYLFSGPSGMGKSTHTRKYLDSFPGSYIINDDKPALRYVGGEWRVYGTPWAGKNGINVNVSVPIAGICFLHRGDRILRRLGLMDILPQLLDKTTYRNSQEEIVELIHLLEKMIEQVPFFDFYNHAEVGDEFITFQTMREAWEDKNGKKQ